MLQQSTTCCNRAQHAATEHNMLQQSTTCCNTPVLRGSCGQQSRAAVPARPTRPHRPSDPARACYTPSPTPTPPVHHTRASTIVARAGKHRARRPRRLYLVAMRLGHVNERRVVLQRQVLIRKQQRQRLREVVHEQLANRLRPCSLQHTRGRQHTFVLSCMFHAAGCMRYAAGCMQDVSSVRGTLQHPGGRACCSHAQSARDSDGHSHFGPFPLSPIFHVGHSRLGHSRFSAPVPA